MRWLFLSAGAMILALALGLSTVYLLSEMRLQDSEAVHQFSATIPDDAAHMHWGWSAFLLILPLALWVRNSLTPKSEA